MQEKTADTNASPASERRAWEAPRLVEVAPVNRTEGGFATRAAELGIIYKPS